MSKRVPQLSRALLGRAAIAGIMLALVLFISSPLGSHADHHIPPGPINPNTGQQSLLNVVNSLPINSITQAVNHFPVPYVIIASADGAEPVIATNRAGAPTRIDADRSRSTGQGNSGHDLIVTVDTVMTPTPHLLLTIDRLGAAPFASDLQVLVAFPFAAFNDEADAEAPNLFLGFQTTGDLDPLMELYEPGGHAPERVQFRLIPGTLAGTSHTFEFEIDTVGASNPLRFLAGHFEAAPGAEAPEDAIAMAMLTDPVPESISLALTIDASPIVSGGATSALVALDWAASAPATVIFDYIENEDFPFDIPDYGTTVSFEQMPTEATLALEVDFASQLLSLSHAGSAPIGEVTLHHRRNDGLDVRALATDVPTAVDVELDFTGSLSVDVSANTMDFALTAVQEDGFPGTDGLFGYPLGFFHVAGTALADSIATWDMTQQSFAVMATNPGESIGSLAFVVADSGEHIGDPAVQLPPDQTGFGMGVGEPWAEATRHVFSLVDDGERGTAAARMVQVRSATLDFSAPDLQNISEAYTLDLAEPARPLTAYLRIEPGSLLIEADIHATCNVHDFPYGVTTFTLELPPQQVTFAYETDPPQGIDEVFCVGSVNSLNFEVLAGDLPPRFEFQFDPEGSFGILAEDGSGGSQPVGTIGVRLWDGSGDDGLGAGTAALLGAVLRDARFRGDDIPSSGGTWSDSPTSTQIEFDTVGTGVFLGGAQLWLSTITEFNTPLLDPAGLHHYLRFADAGGDGPKRLIASAFGIDSFSYSSVEGGGNRMLHVSYAADADRRLLLEIDAAFGGRFFPDFAIDATLSVDDVPAQWSLSTDLATELNYAGSAAIDSIALSAHIDDTNDGVENGTDVSFIAQDLPAEVDFTLDPSGSAALLMSDSLSLLSVSLSSDNEIFGSGYRLVEGALESVPARWEANWSGGDFSLEARDAANEPEPLGSLAVRISTTNDDAENAARLQFFAHPGVDGCRINYSPFLREIDDRYYDASGAPSIPPRLNAIYCESEALQLEPEVEDHLVVRLAGGSVDFLSLQFGGFQRVLVQPDATGGSFELRVPTPGAHPLFVGYGEGAAFTTVRIEDVPDEIDASLDVTSGFTMDASGSAGVVDVYRGPLPTASDGADALRVTIDPLPASIAASWSLGLSGEISFTASEPFEVRLLSQDGGTRIVGAMELQNLSAAWGASGFNAELDYLDPNCIVTLLPVPFVDVCGLSFLQYANAFVNFSADPGLNAFLNVYNGIGNPQELVPAGPPPDTENGEYVPRFTFMLRGFSQLEASASIAQCLPTFIVVVIPCTSPVPPFIWDGAIGIDLDIATDLFDAFTFDFWDLGESPTVITGDPDYIHGHPWHLLSPLLHGFGDHFDPFE